MDVATRCWQINPMGSISIDPGCIRGNNGYTLLRATLPLNEHE